MQTDKERTLLEKAMEAVKKTRAAVEKTKDKCHGNETHDDDILDSVYLEVDKAYDWLSTSEAMTDSIIEAIPVFTSIEKVRDYASKADIPTWELEECRSEIDTLIHEWAMLRAKHTGEPIRDILDWTTKKHPEATNPMSEQPMEESHDNDVEVKIHVHDSHHDDDVRYTPTLSKSLLKTLRSMQEQQALPMEKPCPCKNSPDKDSEEKKPMTRVELTEALKKSQSLIRRMDNLEETDNPMETDTTKDHVRSHNVGQSDYSKHKIQPWDIWEEYNLNPWDADIVKRILRTKNDGRSPEETRIEDYQKIIHVAQERIRQIETNGHV